MKEFDCKMSCTNGVWDVHRNKKSIGGLFDPKKLTYYTQIQNYRASFRIFNGIKQGFENGKKNIIHGEYLKGFNLQDPDKGWYPIISASVVVEKSLLNNVGNFSEIKPPGEDHSTWLKVLKYTDAVLINENLLYYDIGHGYGQEWNK